MADPTPMTRPEHKPVLAGVSAFSGTDVRLEPLPEGHLLHIMGSTDAKTLASRLIAADLKKSSIRSAGFQQWFVVGDESLPPHQVAQLATALSGKAYVSDQSHGRVRIGLSGRKAAEIIAKGSAVDVDPSAFPEGASAVTLYGHIPIQLTRTGTETFELTVLRSYAADLYAELEHYTAVSDRRAN